MPKINDVVWTHKGLNTIHKTSCKKSLSPTSMKRAQATHCTPRVAASVLFSCRLQWHPSLLLTHSQKAIGNLSGRDVQLFAAEEEFFELLPKAEPGEWLDSHTEEGQPVADFRYGARTPRSSSSVRFHSFHCKETLILFLPKKCSPPAKLFILLLLVSSIRQHLLISSFWDALWRPTSAPHVTSSRRSR